MRKYKLDGLTYHVLRIDSTWSIAYDPNNNDRPVYWLRHGERHSEFDEKNGVTAMFYLILEMGKN